MCLYSREAETRLINVGETGDIGPVTPHGGGTSTGVLPRTPESGVACLCIPDGYVLRLSGISVSLMNRLGLVSNTAMAIFREGCGGDHDRDRFEFDNGSEQNLNRELRGCEVVCIAEKVGVEPDIVATASEPEGHLIGVGEGNHVHGGILSARRIGAGVGSMSLLAIFTVLFR